MTQFCIILWCEWDFFGDDDDDDDVSASKFPSNFLLAQVYLKMKALQVDNSCGDFHK